MLTTWSGISQMNRLLDELACDLNDVMGRPIGGTLAARTFTPPLDIRGNEQELVFSLDVPGLKQSDLQINVEDRVLKIHGERKYPGNDNERAWVGRGYGAFDASYVLPDYVDTEKVSAHLADGVLTIVAPKHERARPRRIAITGSAPDDERKQLPQENR
ncbi:MAG TPA: HSP20 family small heat-shock protein [Polyangiaceae bacterium]|nr:HSP20 family small heat-shock protein [Polyangiaceae bacterium]